MTKYVIEFENYDTDDVIIDVSKDIECHVNSGCGDHDHLFSVEFVEVTPRNEGTRKWGPDYAYNVIAFYKNVLAVRCLDVTEKKENPTA